MAIATLSLHILTLVLFVLQGFTIRKLYLRKPPTFVQLINGKKVDFLVLFINFIYNTEQLQKVPISVG